VVGSFGSKRTMLAHSTNVDELIMDVSITYWNGAPWIFQHLKQMSSIVKEINVDISVTQASIISVAHYPDTLYIIWQKILQPHFPRIVTCP
jgi:hypothetical protein